MRLTLIVLTLLLCATAASAQLVTPTTAYALLWDYTGPAFDHFEVRYTTSGAWTNVGRLQQVTAPVLALGAHTVQVRVCRNPTPTAATCPLTALAFTVALTPPATAPTTLTLSQ